MVDLRQTSEYAKYIDAIGWKVEKIEKQYIYIKKFPILGNFIKIQRPELISNLTIKKVVNKYKPFQLVVEPQLYSDLSFLTSNGYKLSKTYFVPSKTVQIDLRKPTTVLLKEMHYKTRYNIKHSGNQNLIIKNSSNIKQFAEFWQKCALSQRGMFLSQEKEIVEIYNSFKKKSDILLCFKDDDLIAGILLLHSNKISYYMYAASSNIGKKLFAPTAIAWEGIKLSKKRGSKFFDFEGIYDERFPLKTWQGFTRFKKSFGGKIVEFPGTYTKFMLPFRLWL